MFEKYILFKNTFTVKLALFYISFIIFSATQRPPLHFPILLNKFRSYLNLMLTVLITLNVKHID